MNRSLVLPLLVVAGVALAYTRVELSDEFGPGTWHDFQTLGLVDGQFFATHDDEWAVITFWRPPEDIPAGFDLLNDFDESVFDSELLVKGFVLFDDEGHVPTAEIQGLGAVPVWFVPWEGLRDAASDDILTIEELEDLDPLEGTADLFQEQNHIYGVHKVSHLATVASGTLEDGRGFEVEAVEVDLELKLVRIELE